jgi:hypothetical protein
LCFGNANTLDQVEKDYLQTISSLEKHAKKALKKNKSMRVKIQNRQSISSSHSPSPMPAKPRIAPKLTVLGDFFGSP